MAYNYSFWVLKALFSNISKLVSKLSEKPRLSSEISKEGEL